MENTFLVGLSQQTAATRAMEVIANNLANLGTLAFKREAVQFEQYVVQLPATEAEPGPAVNVASVLDRGPMRNISTGGMEQTGSLLDVANR